MGLSSWGRNHRQNMGPRVCMSHKWWWSHVTFPARDTQWEHQREHGSDAFICRHFSHQCILYVFIETATFPPQPSIKTVLCFIFFTSGTLNVYDSPNGGSRRMASGMLYCLPPHSLYNFPSSIDCVKFMTPLYLLFKCQNVCPPPFKLFQHYVWAAETDKKNWHKAVNTAYMCVVCVYGTSVHHDSQCLAQRHVQVCRSACLLRFPSAFAPASRN